MSQHVSASIVLACVLLGATLGVATPRGAGTPQLAQVISGATVETAPVPHTGDAADDPAIWVHPSDPSQSTILGTDKLGGIGVYSLAGEQIQFRADGELNNVDLRYNFPFGSLAAALVAAGNHTTNSIALYTIDPATRLLAPVAARTIVPGLSIYGSCMYHSPVSGKYYVFLDAKSGAVEQWELFATADARVDARRVRSFAVGSQVEGCVADDELQALYIAEEAIGIWRYGAEPGGGASRVMVDTTAVGGHVTSNVEGLAIYYTADGGGYLLASSQGSDDFAIYQRAGANVYVGTFAIGAGNGIDRVSHTDGIDVANIGLGSAFPQGLFVAQDGTNDLGNQNFKLVPWQKISAAFAPALSLDTAWDPRTVGAGQLPPGATPSATPSATPLPSSLQFTAVDDTYVSQSQPTTAFGGNTQVQVVGGTSAKQAFLRFVVAGLPSGAVVSAAKLRLYVANDSTSGGMFYGIPAAGWSEATTWNTRPQINGSPLFTQGAAALKSVVEVDVASVVAGNGSYDFAIVAPAKNTDTLGYAASEASSASTRPQLAITWQASPSATATPTPTAADATATPTAADATATAIATATPAAATATPTAADATATPTATATATTTPTIASTPSSTPSSSTRIKDITFESGSLTDPATGVDRIVGAVTLESIQPLGGRYAARIANAGSAYLQEDFSATDNLYVSFLLRLNALPTAEVRIALVSNAGTTVGNLYLRPNGALRLRNNTLAIGADTAPLAVGTLYRVGLRQSRGSGANAQLQAYLATGSAAFGAPFASLATGDWQTPVARLRIGATISTALDAVVDDIRIDSGAMP